MSDFLDKLTSYNLFNYLLPGVLFAALVDGFTSYAVLQTDPIVGVFVYYFCGMVVSRVGSLMLEPFLKWSTFVVFAPYGEFVSASKADPKIDVLSEANNTYRTLAALPLLVLCVKGFDTLASRCSQLANWDGWILAGLLFSLFLFSYRKQTKYVHDRVKAAQ